MATKRRREVLGPDAPPARFLQGRARKARSQRGTPARPQRGSITPVAASEAERRFGVDGDLTPTRKPKEGAAVAASGKTSFYSLDSIKPMDGLETFTGESAEGEEVRRDANGRPVDAPKGGEVEVGTMQQWLMDPSDNPHDLQETTAALHEKKATGGSLDLELAPHQYGVDKTPPAAPKAPEKPKAPKMPSGDLSLKEHPPAPPEKEPEPYLPPPVEDDVVITKMKSKGGAKKKIETGPFLLKWLTPQAVLFLIVLIAGPKYIQNHYVLEGPYQATFTDVDGRKVECSTKFMPEGSKLTGMFECKLYPNRYSLQRVDEPKVLKVIMGGGNIVYSGHYNRNSISLTLGSINEGETRSVSLDGKFDPDINRMTGVLSNPLKQTGEFELVRSETLEE
ncbi:MAG TPA: hypothetical protein PKW95_13805 [bacterium]|nr:hypothetical protein [bacterium]